MNWKIATLFLVWLADLIYGFIQSSPDKWILLIDNLLIGFLLWVIIK